MEKKTNLLEKAISIAVNAHEGQTDKAGAPYVLHCLRVMLRGKTENEQITGVLHDIVEDTYVTIDSLKKLGFPEKITRAVRCLTKNKGMDYSKYIAGVKMNNLASNVKLYDLEDNLDLLRLGEVKEKDLIRLNKYLKTYRELSEEVMR